MTAKSSLETWKAEREKAVITRNQVPQDKYIHPSIPQHKTVSIHIKQMRRLK